MIEDRAPAAMPVHRSNGMRGWSIRLHLTLVALGVALPFLLLSAGIAWQLTHLERETRRDAIMLSARAMMNSVDAFLRKQIAIAETLAVSPALASDDLAAFRLEAERARNGLSGGWIVVSDASGQQLINLARPPLSELPMRNPRGIALQVRAIETRQVQISNVSMGRFLQTPIVTIEVPVFRPNRPPVVIAVIMDPSVFLPLFEQQRLPEGWLTGLIDRNGNFVARSLDHQRTVGKPASEGFRAAARESREGWREMATVERQPVANGHVTSALSGWVLGLAAEKAVFEAPIRRTMWIAALAGAIATLLSVVLALWLARRIVGPIERIEDGAHALLERKPIAFDRTGVAEIDRALTAFTSTAAALEEHEEERDAREAHVHLLMRELSHRSKNLLAIVLAIARQTSKQTSNFEDFEIRFNARIQALAESHDLLVERQWLGATLDDLIRAQLAAFGMERVVLRGEPVLLKSEAVQNVGLALHELATNAAKYGGLSVPEGRVTIEWDHTADGGLRLTWRESGGPPVSEPSRRGFGRFVLERVTVEALGRGSLGFPPEGLVWTCEIDPQHLVDAVTQPATPQRRAGDVAGQPA
jgi:two-component sensor histidine kinase